MKKIIKNNLTPAIIQDSKTGLVLMLGYMNKEALAKTRKTKRVWFFSRSKERLWMKGETSGNILDLVSIKRDCDSDTLLVKVNPRGPVCHTGSLTCWNETPDASDVIQKLFATIISRKKEMPKKSYTTTLLKAGLNKIALKVAEETLEVIQAAQKESNKRLTEETVDLLYHLFVLLAQKNISLKELEAEIKNRHKP